MASNLLRKLVTQGLRLGVGLGLYKMEVCGGLDSLTLLLYTSSWLSVDAV